MPKTIYDMYGFPKELYEIIYNSPGSPSLAKVSKELISKDTEYDNSWGIDHGTWSVLIHMYPERDMIYIYLTMIKRWKMKLDILMREDADTITDIVL